MISQIVTHELGQLQSRGNSEVLHSHGEDHCLVSVKFLRQSSAEELDLLRVLAQEHSTRVHVSGHAARVLSVWSDCCSVKLEPGPELVELGDGEQELVREASDEELSADTRHVTNT